VKRLVPAWLAFLLVSAVSPAVRAEAAAAELAEARSLFGQAVALEGAGDYRQAATKLELALAIKETPGLRYHLAHCQEQSGSLVAAGTNYERAAELIRGGAVAPDVEPLLPAASQRLETRVARLLLVLPSGVSASAEVDGRPLRAEALRTPVALDPGRHRLLVRSRGHADFRADLGFSSGEHRTVRVLFDSPGEPAVPSPPVVPPARAEPRPSAPSRGLDRRKVVLASEAVVALVGVGLGVGFTAVRGNAAERAEAAQRELDAPSSATSDCASTPVPACGDLRRAIDEHQRATTIATASLTGAGVAASALALTWVLWPSSWTTASLVLRPQTAGVELRAGGAF